MGEREQHTPGPWKWLGDCLEGPDYSDVIGSKVACGAWCQGGSCVLTISDADKALIEAAPDLLDALRAVDGVSRESDSALALSLAMDRIIDQVRAAISKATAHGGSNG